MKLKCNTKGLKCYAKRTFNFYGNKIKNMSTKNKLICGLILLALILLRDLYLFAIAEIIGWLILMGIGCGIGFLLLKFKKVFFKHQ